MFYPHDEPKYQLCQCPRLPKLAHPETKKICLTKSENVNIVKFEDQRTFVNIFKDCLTSLKESSCHPPIPQKNKYKMYDELSTNVDQSDRPRNVTIHDVAPKVSDISSNNYSRAQSISAPQTSNSSTSTPLLSHLNDGNLMDSILVSSPSYDELNTDPSSGMSNTLLYNENIPDGWKIGTIISNTRGSSSNQRTSNPANLVNISTNNQIAYAKNLPTFQEANMRSLFPKIGNFLENFKRMGGSIALICEVWERKKDRKTQDHIAKIYEQEGFQYFSQSRSSKRGGGVAILVNNEEWTAKVINFNNEFNLEIIWALVTSCWKDGNGKAVTKIIAGSFYAPPRSRK